MKLKSIWRSTAKEYPRLEKYTTGILFDHRRRNCRIFNGFQTDGGGTKRHPFGGGQAVFGDDRTDDCQNFSQSGERLCRFGSALWGIRRSVILSGAA